MECAHPSPHYTPRQQQQQRSVSAGVRDRQSREGGRERGPEERAEQAQAGEGGGGNVALVVSFAARLLPPPALEKPVLPSLVQVVHQHQGGKQLNCVTHS